MVIRLRLFYLFFLSGCAMVATSAGERTAAVELPPFPLNLPETLALVVLAKPLTTKNQSEVTKKNITVTVTPPIQIKLELRIFNDPPMAVS